MKDIAFNSSVILALVLLCTFLYLIFRRNHLTKKLYIDIIAGQKGMIVYYYNDNGEEFHGTVRGDYDKEKQTVLVRRETGEIETIMIKNIYPSVLN